MTSLAVAAVEHHGDGAIPSELLAEPSVQIGSVPRDDHQYGWHLKIENAIVGDGDAHVKGAECFI